MIDQVTNYINEFLKTSLKLYGKEIGLSSGEFYTFDFINNGKENEGELQYSIQYGFPQSGCVFLNFSFFKGTNRFTITDVSVYAPSDDKPLESVKASFTDQDGAVSVSINAGLDCDTKENVGVSGISSSHNATDFLKMALDDIASARVLGECFLAVRENSERIPCVDAHKLEEEIGTR